MWPGSSGPGLRMAGYGRDYEAEAVKLLGQAGERAIHAEMERKFTEELSRRVGPDLEVTVSIRPKETGDG